MGRHPGRNACRQCEPDSVRPSTIHPKMLVGNQSMWRG
jgi:hypothetical protein